MPLSSIASPRSLFARTMSEVILDELGRQNRKYLSTWRSLLIVRRATDTLRDDERRWSRYPTTESDLSPLLRQMERRGQIERMPGMTRMFRITVPFARNFPASDEELLLEINPYATVSHLSAFVFHGLTNQLPNSFTMLVASPQPDDLLPLGTTADDWVMLEMPPGRMPPNIARHKVRWSTTAASRYFGLGIYEPQGFPIRVTTPERTLLDGLLEPVLCGGMSNVLSAWGNSRYTLNVDLVVQYVERFDIGILRQRAGYVLESLDLRHEALERWQAAAQRGDSSKLIGSEPYAAAFSERWNLSLNGPVYALHCDEE